MVVLLTEFCCSQILRYGVVCLTGGVFPSGTVWVQLGTVPRISVPVYRFIKYGYNKYLNILQFSRPMALGHRKYQRISNI